MNEKPRFDLHTVAKAFGSSVNQYDQHAGLQQEVAGECIALAKAYWEKGAHILDVGTGTGMFAREVQEQQLGWHTTGLDLSLAMCRAASNVNAAVVNANAESLPFANNVFDGVFSSLMLQWSNAPLSFFKELERVIAPGGTCVIATFTHGTLDELRDSFESIDAHRHINEFGPPNYFSALAAHAGFRLLSSEEEVFTEYYPDVMTLFRALKTIGASTKEQGHIRKGLMTPRQLQQVEKRYRQKFVHTDGLPVTWEVMIMILEKP